MVKILHKVVDVKNINNNYLYFLKKTTTKILCRKKYKTPDK